MARSSEYDFKKCIEICELVANGQNITKVLKSNNQYPTWSTFRRWKSNHSELRTLYVNAVQDKSEPLLQEMDDILTDLRNGKIEPSVANVLIQAIKWKMAKFYPKMFGDKTRHEVTGEDGGDIVVKIEMPEDM